MLNYQRVSLILFEMNSNKKELKRYNNLTDVEDVGCKLG
jgi:hypothetical protein